MPDKDLDALFEAHAAAWENEDPDVRDQILHVTAEQLEDGDIVTGTSTRHYPNVYTIRRPY